MTVTAPTRSTGCGCGCGGSATSTSGAFLRPRFFAGQLLTEDDLQALTAYITGKDRLRNRLLSGAGVVCGLDVVCDPCGGGKVTVRPGYALDPCGNDIVVGCAEKVDIVALVRDLRVRSLGADCGDPCDTDREYGLHIRYVEEAIAPIAPYATDESCPPDGCAPSRIRETYTFVVKCVEEGDARYVPAHKLTARIGGLDTVQPREQRLAGYREPMAGAVRAAGTAVLFDGVTAERYHAGRTDLTAVLGQIGEGGPTPAQAHAATEHVRALASAVARYDLYDAAGRAQLVDRYDLRDVEDARRLLGQAATTLDGTATESMWPDPLRRAVARAVVDQTREVVVGQGAAAAPLEARLLAQGAPLDYALRAELFADLGVLRQWLLVRLDKDRDVADCEIRPFVAQTVLPGALPAEPPPGREQAGATELMLAAEAASRLGPALLRYVSDAACASILPPCAEAGDGDVLLAHVELDECEVVRACTTGRQQWLPGGPGYAAWAPILYQARELAAQVCCQPVPEPSISDTSAPEGPVHLGYAHGLLLGEPEPTPLDELLGLLLPAPEEQRPAPAPAIPGPAATDTAETAALRREVAELRDLLGGLTSEVAALRTAGPAAQPAPDPSPPASTEGSEESEESEEPAGSGRPAKKAAKAVPRKATRPTRRSTDPS
jgi:hypothetical protein